MPAFRGLAGDGRILGVETSCDESAVAIVDDGRTLRANCVASQHAVHGRFGGIVPELASRAHVTALPRLYHDALAEAGCTIADIDAIAVTTCPGLIGALLVGVEWAKGLAYAHDLPLVGVNHLEGHLVAIQLTDDPPPYPHLGVIVSGGHTAIYLVADFGRYTCVAETRDDAAGEALDKIAKYLGLGYPGGPCLEKLARTGDADAYPFPRVRTRKGVAFSYSGLKTAAVRRIDEAGETLHANDFAASFQAAVMREVVDHTRDAVRAHGVTHVVLGGGVAANQYLRDTLGAALRAEGATLHVPPRALCTDNAAMIAAAGFQRLDREGPDDLTVTARARAAL